MALDTTKNEGVVHTFFPIDLKIPMVSPDDIGELIAEVMLEPLDTEEIYHIEAQQHYSSVDVADAFSEALNKKVEAVEIKPEAWRPTLIEMGFSKVSADSFADMTQSVVDGRTTSESRSNLHKGKTTLREYIEKLVKQSDN